MYKIKEIYYTIQGEGFHTGQAAVFCRFTGCNLWSGLEKDRQSAVCKFCDTDFRGTDGVNGGKYTAIQLTQKIHELWVGDTRPFVVFTGGEPGLQLDDTLVSECQSAHIYTAVETNGTVALPEGLDWITVSPKANAELVLTTGSELKLVYPQVEHSPDDFEHLDFDHFYLQPCDDANQSDNIKSTTAYCLANPKWKLSLQTHKILGID